MIILLAIIISVVITSVSGCLLPNQFAYFVTTFILMYVGDRTSLASSAVHGAVVSLLLHDFAAVRRTAK